MSGNQPVPFSFGRTAQIVIFSLLAVLYLGFLLWTLPTIPFHPDEATYIYMSRDLERIITDGPISICWQPGEDSNPLQVERVRDCPLARYWIGTAGLLSGLPATESNWNWSADWNQNLAQAALPSQELLFGSRLPQALLLFLATLLMARIGWRLGGAAGAVSAGILFGLNSQVLLHGRRAMSEAALLFGMILLVVVIMEKRELSGRILRMAARPLCTGAALALAVSAKYSGLLMAPVALAGMFIGTGETAIRKFALKVAQRFGILVLGFLFVFLALNPLYWCSPWGTLSAVVSERQRLTGEQVATLQTAGPGLVLDSMAVRGLAVPYELFLAPPAFWDVPNYAADTEGKEQVYLSQPLQALTSGGIGSLAFGFLFLMGLGVVTLRLVKFPSDPCWWILVIWFLSILGGIIAGVPILWQRYYLPLIPVCCAFSAAAIAGLVEIIFRRKPALPADIK